jgi:anaerobic selenocysteine-containing dehydrogenase
MTCSINIESKCGSNVSKMTAEVINSINNSMHNSNKNKRKSDYMEMRDRLRKPNVLHKVGK